MLDILTTDMYHTVVKEMAKPADKRYAVTSEICDTIFDELVLYMFANKNIPDVSLDRLKSQFNMDVMSERRNEKWKRY